MKKADFQELVGRYTEGVASPAERRLLEAYYERLAGNYDPLPADQEESLRKEMLRAIFERAAIPSARVIPLRKRPWTWVAAASVILLVAGMYFLWPKHQSPVPIAQTQQQRFRNDVPPGGNHAVLTLAGGKTIILDTAANGTLAQQGRATVRKLTGGRLGYEPGNAPPGVGGRVLYNTLSTPRGGQYQLTLSDGTRVWLNAQSSITYPTAFIGKTREVTVTGEAYFEVIHKAAQPFRVKAAGQLIEDIGTAFNVNAYPDEPAVKTTLLEGRVAVSAANNVKTELSSPGQQARLDASGHIEIRKDVDVEEVLAWKNGLFRFNDASIRDILQQAARWYDVEIDDQTGDKLGFVATISRNVPISKLLQILELTDRVHFTIDGKKITVLP